jgi:hypothetical protein
MLFFANFCRFRASSHRTCGKRKRAIRHTSKNRCLKGESAFSIEIFENNTFPLLVWIVKIPLRRLCHSKRRFSSKPSRDGKMSPGFWKPRLPRRTQHRTCKRGTDALHYLGHRPCVRSIHSIPLDITSDDIFSLELYEWQDHDNQDQLKHLHS